MAKCVKCGSSNGRAPRLVSSMWRRLRGKGIWVWACGDCGHIEFDPPIDGVHYVEVDTSPLAFRRAMGLDKDDKNDEKRQ